MPIATFAPEIAPSPGSQRTPEVKLRKSEFGDGYTQASPAGLNHIRRTLALKWDGVSPAQLAALNAFFEAQGGYKPFWYTHAPEGVQRKWTCDTWGVTYGAPASFTATLREDFSNAV